MGWYKLEKAGYDAKGHKCHSARWALEENPGLFCQWSHQYQVPASKYMRWGVWFAPRAAEENMKNRCILSLPQMKIAMALNGQRFATRREALQAIEIARLTLA